MSAKKLVRVFNFYNSIALGDRLQISLKNANSVFALYCFFLVHIIPKLAKHWRFSFQEVKVVGESHTFVAGSF